MQEILNRKPQVILLGNGLNLAFGDSPTSWTELLEKLTADKYKGKINPKTLPNTLQIILRTNGEVNGVLKEYKDELKGNPLTDDLAGRIRKIFEMKPDHILTTNYSYEVEAAAAGKKKLSDSAIRDMQKHTSEVAKCEPQYMIHTYNEADGVPVWHIHGEARKPRSIVVGHYWYGSLLTKYKNLTNDRRKTYDANCSKGIFKVQSWLDAFILGDVYVLGFGYDVSEIDLWWLLNRKRFEKSENKGKLYYYSNMDTGEFDEKEELLKVCGAEVIHCNELKGPDIFSSNKYRNYCDAALMDISQKILTNRLTTL